MLSKFLIIKNKNKKKRKGEKKAKSNVFMNYEWNRVRVLRESRYLARCRDLYIVAAAVNDGDDVVELAKKAL